MILFEKLRFLNTRDIHWPVVGKVTTHLFCSGGRGCGGRKASDSLHVENLHDPLQK